MTNFVSSTISEVWCFSKTSIIAAIISWPCLFRVHSNTMNWLNLLYFAFLLLGIAKPWWIDFINLFIMHLVVVMHGWNNFEDLAGCSPSSFLTHILCPCASYFSTGILLDSWSEVFFFLIFLYTKIFLVLKRVKFCFKLTVFAFYFILLHLDWMGLKDFLGFLWYKLIQMTLILLVHLQCFCIWNWSEIICVQTVLGWWWVFLFFFVITPWMIQCHYIISFWQGSFFVCLRVKSLFYFVI